MSGEEEVYVIAQDGLKPPQQITSGGQAMRYQPEWSADGKRLAFSDKDGKLYVVTLADKKLTEIIDAPRGQIRDYTWSPSGNYLAFSMATNGNGFSQLHIWNGADNKVTRVTSQISTPIIPRGIRRALSLLPQRSRIRAAIPQIEFNFATTARLHLRHGFA